MLREEVIEPLGLKDTTIDRIDVREPRLIHGYITVQANRLDATDNAGAADSPSVGVTSTVADLNTFYGALFEGKLVSEASLKAMKQSSNVRCGAGSWSPASMKRWTPSARDRGAESI